MEQQQPTQSPNYNQQANLPNATASLVLGIISIPGAFCYGIVGLICGIIGLILANKDRQLYHSAPELYSPASFSQSNAGRICSIIGLVIAGLVILYVIFVLIVFGGLIWGSSRHYSF